MYTYINIQICMYHVHIKYELCKSITFTYRKYYTYI